MTTTHLKGRGRVNSNLKAMGMITSSAIKEMGMFTSNLTYLIKGKGDGRLPFH